MANTPRHVPDEPHPPAKSPPEAAAQILPQPEGGADYTVHNPDPPVETIADEQRKRSAEIEEVGVDAYMKAHNPPPAGAENQPKQVAGVQHTPEPEHHGRR